MISATAVHITQRDLCWETEVRVVSILGRKIKFTERGIRPIKLFPTNSLWTALV